MIDRTWLRRAARIADRIGEQALWNGLHCRWHILELDPTAPADRRGTYRLADGTIYQGTAGIAWLFAELASRTGDAKHRRLAQGAFVDALIRVRELPSAAFGFHSGRVGVAFVAARLADLLDRPRLRRTSRALLEPLVGRSREDRGLDVIAGAAGAIPALLEIAPAIGAPARDLAVGLGDRLIETARREPGGWCWLGTGGETRGLTGLAHGAAGAALALLELAAATGEERFHFAAEMAFLYERRQFDSAEGNWPDFRHRTISELLESGRIDRLRQLAVEDRIPAYRPSCMAAWCHGAPGIGLSRLRAFELTGQETYRREAELALEATRRTLDPPDRISNVSLCHGRFGNAELLLEASRTLDRPSERERAARLAEEDWLAHEEAGKAWPCGTIDRRPDPSLMLGEAGVAFFLLRLADPSVPSPLLLRPASPGLAAERPELRQNGRGRLAEQVVERAFGETLATWAVLTGSPVEPPAPVASSVAGPADETPAEATHRALLDELSRAPTELRLLLEDAVRVDLARFEAETALQDLTEDLLTELRRPAVDRITWPTARFEIPPPGRIVRTRFDWPALLRDGALGAGRPLPEAGPPRFVLLARLQGRIVPRPVGPFAGLILEALEGGQALEGICRHLEEVTDLGGARGGVQLRAKVRAQVVALLEGGLVRLVSSVGHRSTRPRRRAGSAAGAGA